MTKIWVHVHTFCEPSFKGALPIRFMLITMFLFDFLLISTFNIKTWIPSNFVGNPSPKPMTPYMQVLKSLKIYHQRV